MSTGTERNETGPAPGANEPASDRRGFFKAAAVGAVAGMAHGKFGSAPVSPAQAQGVAAPATPRLSERPWWPSRWGAGDEAGASNHITPAKVLETVRRIQDGKVYKLARNYETGMPMFGARAFAVRVPGAPTGGPFGDNRMIYNDEFIAAELGQAGTQFDGLGHIGIQMGRDGDRNEMRYYNGFTSTETNDAYGLKKLGVEKIKPLLTRGHLIDVMGLRGRMWEAGEEISVADVRAALQRQNMREEDIRPGDAIFFHTGWGSLWMRNNDRFTSGEPGIGLEVARWVVEKDLCLTGADTWAVEVVPNPDKALAFIVHTELQTKHGILNQENMVFDELVADRKYQFAYIFAPTPIKGATGSSGCPIAVT